jgi:hypothetical protein
MGFSQNTPPCPPHHWVLERPNGTPFVAGRCKLCGAVRTNFTSSSPSVWSNKGYRKTVGPEGE